MKRATLLVMCRFVTIPALFWLAIVSVAAPPAEMIRPSVRFAGCFQDNELNESFATLKLQPSIDVGKVSQSLLTKARSSLTCRTQLVQTLIGAMEQAENTTNHNEKYHLWENGASLLMELKATEALDLLIANIDLNNGFPSSLNDFPLLVAILKIGPTAIPKLQTVLRNDSQPSRRRFAAFAIAYIGGRQAKRALSSSSASETDPCVKNFIRLSLQAFDNRAKPNHISSALNGKWLSALYCL